MSGVSPPAETPSPLHEMALRMGVSQVCTLGMLLGCVCGTQRDIRACEDQVQSMQPWSKQTGAELGSAMLEDCSGFM